MSFLKDYTNIWFLSGCNNRSSVKHINQIDHDAHFVLDLTQEAHLHNLKITSFPLKEGFRRRCCSQSRVLRLRKSMRNQNLSSAVTCYRRCSACSGQPFLWSCGNDAGPHYRTAGVPCAFPSALQSHGRVSTVSLGSTL